MFVKLIMKHFCSMLKSSVDMSTEKRELIQYLHLFFTDK